MARRIKITLALLGIFSSAFAYTSEFLGSYRVMDVMITELDRGQAALDAGDSRTALAYAECVLMDRQEKVFLDTSRAGNGTAGTAQDAFKAALQMWTESLPNAADIVYVDSADQADVVVEFSPQVVSEGLNVAGNIHWWRSLANDSSGELHASVKAVIQVRTQRPGGREAMSFELMRHTCAHEIGHLLGLADSYRVGDLMGPLDLRAPVSHLSDSELQAMREMREQALHLRSVALTADSLTAARP